MIPDKLLINLKILSKVQKNGRITRSYDGIISLDQEKIYQAVKRFLTADSRKQAIFEINSIVTECKDTIHNILNSKFMSTDYHKCVQKLDMLINEMTSACQGIENLRFTYQNDPNTVSQIDIILLKMKTMIQDINDKIHPQAYAELSDIRIDNV
jgi:hypothetical protein